MNSKISHDSEILANGQQVITACVFIHAKVDGVTKVFMAKRASTKKFLPDVYEFPGGHIEFGEDIIEGLKREVMEEFGMKVRVGDPFAVFSYINDIKKSHSVEIVYFAQFVDAVEKIQINPEDHSLYRWFAENEIQEVIDANRKEDDPEVVSMRKGFSLLRRVPPAFN